MKKLVLNILCMFGCMSQIILADSHENKVLNLEKKIELLEQRLQNLEQKLTKDYMTREEHDKNADEWIEEFFDKRVEELFNKLKTK